MCGEGKGVREAKKHSMGFLTAARGYTQRKFNANAREQGSQCRKRRKKGQLHMIMQPFPSSAIAFSYGSRQSGLSLK